MQPLRKAPQTTQRSDLRSKYSAEDEFVFWKKFSDSGFMEFENLAVNAWISPRSRILDVGCGCGREALVLARMGHHMFAMDIVPRMIGTTMQRFRQEGLTIRIVQGDVCDGIPFRGRFDAAVLFEQVYQHIPSRRDRVHALRNISEHLYPDGIVLLSAFNEGDIDLGARFLWLQESDWNLAKAIVLDNSNPLSSRYLSDGGSLRSDSIASCWSERLAVGRWVLAYSLNLLKRKVRSKFSKALASEPGSHQCKRIGRTNPLTRSEGSFLLQVLSFGELERELTEAGLEMCDVSALLESEDGFSNRAKRGSPLYTIVARRRLSSAKEEDHGPSPV